MQYKRGFTLIELLVVIAIIGILATLVITQLGTARVKARNSAAKLATTEMGKAIETYKTSTNDFLLLACTAQTAGTGNGGVGAGDTLNGTTGTAFLTKFNGTTNYPVKINETTGQSTAYTYVYKTSTTSAQSPCTNGGQVDAVSTNYLVGTNVKAEASGATDSTYYINNGSSSSAASIPLAQ